MREQKADKSLDKVYKIWTFSFILKTHGKWLLVYKFILINRLQLGPVSGTFKKKQREQIKVGMKTGAELSLENF